MAFWSILNEKICVNMNNIFLNNKTFAPFAHGARREAFLSEFILYPLRATSPTRGTLGESVHQINLNNQQ